MDDRFLFINSGYNLRPTEVQAAIAQNQFKRLGNLISIRKKNRNKIIDAIKKNPKWDDQFKFVKESKWVSASWFGLPIIIKLKYLKKKKKFLKYLTKIGIENRPILSGNFTNQPSTQLYKLNKGGFIFSNAEKIENLGFFIGLHTNKISNSIAKYISNNLLKITEF